LGSGAPVAYSAPRCRLAHQSSGPPADGRHRPPLPVHRGGPQSFAAPCTGDSQTLRARVAARDRSRGAGETPGVRGLVCGAARRTERRREARHMSVRRWPRRAVMTFIRMLTVLVRPGILFPPKKPVNRTGGQAVGDTGRAADTARTPAPPAESVAGAFLSVCPPVRPPAAVATLAETIWVSARHAR